MRQAVDQAFAAPDAAGASWRCRAFVFLLRLRRAKEHVRHMPPLELVRWMRRYDHPPRPGAVNAGCRIAAEQIGGRTSFTFTPPTPRQDALIVYLHAGGYVCGPLIGEPGFVSRIAAATGFSACMPDYPKAPEHRWRETQAWTLDFYREIVRRAGSRRIVVIGTSAGGGLALAQSLIARKEGLRLPDRLILVSPWVDLSMSNPALARIEPFEPTNTIEASAGIGRLYAGGDDPSHPLISPVNGDLAGLPPLAVFDGGHDLLAADSQRLVQKARACGVPVENFLYPELVHAFAVMSFLPEGQRAQAQIVDLLQAA